VLGDILTRAELPDADIFAAHEVALWPKGTLGWLSKAGILQEAERAQEIVCEECEDRCQIKPVIRKDPQNRQRVGKCFCAQKDDVGPFTVSLDRMRQWAFNLIGLARVVAKAVGATGRLVVPEPGRLVMLGTAKVDGKVRELFLARGTAWSDAAQVFGKCSRLKIASHPAVLTLTAMPTDPLLAGRELAVRPLAEIASVLKGTLQITLDGAFPEVAANPLADIPTEPITLDKFMVKYCEFRSLGVRRNRRKALLAAARNKTVEMPPLAGSYESGQSKKYFVHDLLKAWQGYQEANLDLPPLLSQYRSS
jgi:hypothetical protein